MYTPSHYKETRLSVLHELVRAQPFAALVSGSGDGLDAEHLPLLLDDTRGEFGVLQGHVARANPVWKRLEDGASMLAIFQGPHHYISPNWYPSKRGHGKAVPTWNYVVVHAHGRVRWQHDAGWLRGLVERLTNSHERGRAQPWQVSDAPADYIEKMVGAIVGFEIELTAIHGKWKLTQNRDAADQAGVIAGLEEENNPQAAAIAECMRNGRGDGHL